VSDSQHGSRLRGDDSGKKLFTSHLQAETANSFLFRNVRQRTDPKTIAVENYFTPGNNGGY
jgi:hypothetical protein